MELTKEKLGEALSWIKSAHKDRYGDNDPIVIIENTLQSLHDNWDALENLYKQATEERSHYYVGSVIKKLIGANQ